MTEFKEDPPDEFDEIFLISPVSTTMAPRVCRGPDGPGVTWKNSNAEWLLEFENEKQAQNLMFKLSKHIYQNHYQRKQDNEDVINKFVQDLQKLPQTPSKSTTATTSTTSTQTPTKPQNYETKSEYQSPVAVQNVNLQPRSPIQTKITPKKYTQSPPRFKAQKKVIEEEEGEEVKFATGLFSVQSGGENLLIGTDIRISIVETETGGKKIRKKRNKR